jgi:hypothetical protein
LDTLVEILIDRRAWTSSTDYADYTDARPAGGSGRRNDTTTRDRESP